MSDPLINPTEDIVPPIKDEVVAGKSQSLPNLDVPQLRGYFDLPSPTSDQKNDLKMMWDYLSKTAEGPGDALYQLKQIENRLAAPHLGQTRFTVLRDYIKVLRSLDDLSKERDSFQR